MTSCQFLTEVQDYHCKLCQKNYYHSLWHKIRKRLSSVTIHWTFKFSNITYT